jgi:hypothetical protein
MDGQLLLEPGDQFADPGFGQPLGGAGMLLLEARQPGFQGFGLLTGLSIFLGAGNRD